MAIAFILTICEDRGMQELPDKPKPLAELLGISVPYAYALLKGERKWTQTLAVSAYRKTGSKVGPIENATDEQIEALEQILAQAA